MTKRENITAMLNDSYINSNADWKAYLENELALLDKKNKAPKKATKTQIENEALKDKLLDVLRSASAPMTASAIAEALGVSVNKASALLTQLKEDNSVNRDVVKRKAYFTIA